MQWLSLLNGSVVTIHEHKEFISKIFVAVFDKYGVIEKELPRFEMQ
jgi:hypothetical protein